LRPRCTRTPGCRAHGLGFRRPFLGPANCRAEDPLPELARTAASGTLTLPVWRTYPLDGAAAAHTDLEAHRNHGKTVLLP
ncbi:zinc-binding dehydrogenase, partial [Streptomyces sp900105245]